MRQSEVCTAGPPRLDHPPCSSSEWWSASSSDGVWARPGRAKVETWRQEGPSAFAKCHREGVVISDNGRVRLGHARLARRVIGGRRGSGTWHGPPTASLLAATGDSGKVFRREPQAGCAWTVALRRERHAGAVAGRRARMGRSSPAPGPNGQVVNLTDPKHPASRPDPKVQYIWDLAADPQGNLYAATGPNGQLWKRSTRGQVVAALRQQGDSPALRGHRSRRVGLCGQRWRGPDLSGRAAMARPRSCSTRPRPRSAPCWWPPTARSTRGRRPRPAARERVAQLAVPHASGMPHDSRRIRRFRSRLRGGRRCGRRRRSPLPRLRRASPDLGRTAGTRPPRAARPRRSRSRPATMPFTDSMPTASRARCSGSRRLSTPWPGPTIDLLGRHRSRGPALRGPRPRARRRRRSPSSITARSSRCWPSPDGGTPDRHRRPGLGASGLSAGYATIGRLVSEVHDTKLVSRFGSLSWRADPAARARRSRSRPARATWASPTRPGRPGRPSRSTPASARVASPPGRFVQYRVKLATTDPRRTPELRSVSLSYRTSNLAPEITQARCSRPEHRRRRGPPDPAQHPLGGDRPQRRRAELSRVFVRKDGWPDWIRLNEDPITEKTFAWDTTAFPSGTYRVKLVASDRPSNSPDDALTRERESLTFLVDHDPPRVALAPKSRGAAIALTDDLTRLVKADYALDGGPWTPIFPDDGLFDSPREQITLSSPGPQAGDAPPDGQGDRRGRQHRHGRPAARRQGGNPGRELSPVRRQSWALTHPSRETRRGEMTLRHSRRRRRGVTRGDVVVLLLLIGATAMSRADGRLSGQRERAGWRDAPQPLADRLRPGALRPDARASPRDRAADPAETAARRRTPRTAQDPAGGAWTSPT